MYRWVTLQLLCHWSLLNSSKGTDQHSSKIFPHLYLQNIQVLQIVAILKPRRPRRHLPHDDQTKAAAIILSQVNRDCSPKHFTNHPAASNSSQIINNHQQHGSIHGQTCSCHNIAAATTSLIGLRGQDTPTVPVKLLWSTFYMHQPL